VRSVKRTHRELVPRRVGELLVIEVTGMHFGIGQDNVALLVDERDRIAGMARRRRPRFEIGERDSYRELAGQLPEMGHEAIVLAHRLIEPALVRGGIRDGTCARRCGVPQLWRLPEVFLGVRKRAERIPRFREERQIGPHRLSAATKRLSLGQKRRWIRASRHLE